MCDKVTIVLLHLLLLQSLGLVFLINRWRLIIFLFTEKQIITLMGSIKAQNPPFTLHSSLYCWTQLWEEALRALKVRIFKKLNRVNMTALQTTCTFPKHYTKVPTHKFTILPSYSLSSLFFFIRSQFDTKHSQLNMHLHRKTCSMCSVICHRS